MFLFNMMCIVYNIVYLYNIMHDNVHLCAGESTPTMHGVLAFRAILYVISHGTVYNIIHADVQCGESTRNGIYL